MNLEIYIYPDKTYIGTKLCSLKDKPEGYRPEIDECIDVLLEGTEEILRCIVKGWQICFAKRPYTTLFVNTI